MNIDTTRPHFEDRNRQAELDARNTRLDRDRIISAALDALVDDAKRCALYPEVTANLNSWLIGSTGVLHTADVLSAIDDIKRSLSPLVR